MNLLHDRLLEYLPGLTVAPEELARRLTEAGVAVERVTRREDGSVLLETDITSNRPDLLSYIGVAREVAALWGSRLRVPEPGPAEAPDPAAAAATIAVEDGERCHRYSARVVRGVRVGASPPWLCRVLEASGLRPINNIVDVTNFVLLELNHPLHAFDLERLEQRTVRVRRAAPGEALRTLDGVARKLDGEDLVIADATRPIALAGVMGGADSEIGPGTRDILIESAWFAPAGIRRSATRHGLRTEASTRFERGADAEITVRAATRAAELILELAGGQLLSGAIDVQARPLERRAVTLRLARLPRILGIEIPQAEVLRLLAAIGLGPRLAAPGCLEALIPGYRPDLEREIDLIEEVGRLHGYRHVPARLPRTELAPPGRSRSQHRERLTRATLESCGWSEAVTLSMVDPAAEQRFAPAIEPVRLANPLSDRLAALRSTVVAGLAECVAHNLRSGAEEVLLYEVARVFLPGAPGAGPRETLHLGLAIGGRRGHDRDARRLLASLVGTLERLAQVLRLGPLALGRSAGPHAPATLSWAGEPWGTAWLPDTEVLRALDLERNADLAVAELDLERALGLAPPVLRYLPFPRFPSTNRDISLFVTAATASDVLAAVTLASRAEPLVADLRFVGREHVSSDRRVSLVVRVSYAAPDRTLSAEEVEAAHGRLRAVLRADPRFELREG